MQAGGDVSIALYQGPSYPRADYTHDVSALLAFHRERFVGRDRELAFVAEQAGGREPGYLLVEAPGGFGKSTLLAQVVDRVAGGQWRGSVPALACFFVRADGARNTSAAFLAAVNAQLLGLLGLPGGTPPGIGELQTQFSELWSAAAQRATAARPVLLVVDGLDEMADEDVSVADVLPAGLGPYVHVVVSSRDVPDARERVERVHPLRTATVMSLPAFGLEGIRLMLERYGVGAGDADGVAGRILAITGGEPLFARFVCEELGQRGVSELDRLEAEPPGDAEDYFREQLRRLDEADLGDVSWQILGTLVVAHGGMTAAELAEALGRPARVLRPALRPVERFLLGEERLDIFHRRLRELVAGEFAPAELAGLRRGIVDWCAGYGALGWPDETPAYVLDHYPAHLAEDDPTALVALPDLAWMTRRRHATGSLGSFIADVELALDNAAASADQVRLCLVLASARSVATSAAAAAVGVLAQLGYVSEARSYVELIQGEERRADAFRELGAALHVTGDAAGAHEAFIAAVQRMAAVEYKLSDFVGVLEAVAVTLGDAADVEALTALLAVAESVEFDHARATSIAAAATALARAGAAEPARMAVAAAAAALLARAAGDPGPRTDDEDDEDEEGIEAGAVGALAAAAGTLALRDELEALDVVAVGPQDLAGVAEGWARLGEERRALDVAARIAGDVADAVPVLKADCFAAVRRELARRALATLPPAADKWGYGVALEAAATAAMAAGDAQAVGAAAAAVTGDDEAALVSAAVGWASLQRGPEAVAALRSMRVGDGSYLDMASPRVATTLAGAGRFDDALEAAALAVHPAARGAGIAAVARGRLDAGDAAGALADARRALSEGETLAETGEAAALAVLAGVFARAGDAARAAEATEQARVALEEILPGARTDGDAGPVFGALLSAGRLEAARAVADGEYPDARSLAELAHAHARHGDRDTALELVERVVEMAHSSAFGTELVDLLFEVGATHAALGDDAEANACVDRALAIDDPSMEAALEVRKIARLVANGRRDDAVARARHLAEDADPGSAAHALAAAGLADEAVPFAREAIAAWVPDDDDVDGGRSAAVALAERLSPDEALEAIRALRPGAAQIRAPYWRTGHLAALAAALHPLDPVEARAVAMEALWTARLAGRHAFLMSVVVPAAEVVAECASPADLYDWVLEVGGWWARDSGEA